MSYLLFVCWISKLLILDFLCLLIVFIQYQCTNSSELKESYDKGLKFEKAPKNLKNQQQKLSSPSNQNKLSFSNLINYNYLL